jgi:hypothetical protein
MDSKTTEQQAKELHRDLFSSTVRDRAMLRLEVKLIQKYLDEAFEAGRAHER